ncbi:MAG: hypothetical protein HONBIEJF_02554 [Fimbriimonadaceae bacterium]|nr:hypothetical protein [Fimbriimonadaceae bacterium]
MTFQKWMQEVNEICVSTHLMSIYDLPDMPFYDAYGIGQTPEEFMADMIPDIDALAELVLS